MQITLEHAGRKYLAEIRVENGELLDIESVTDITDEDMPLDLPDWSGLEPLVLSAVAELNNSGMRHLRGKLDDARTMCGLPLLDVKTVHPSKVTKDDCPECRAAWRRYMKLPALTKGEIVEFPDLSWWRIDDVLTGSAVAVCIKSGAVSKAGKRLTIGLRSDVRRVMDIELHPEPAPAPVSAPTVSAPTVSAPVSETHKKEGSATTADKVRVKRVYNRVHGQPTHDEVRRVLELRSIITNGKPMSYIAIEQAMGWPAGHGNRPFRIVNGSLKPKD